jgi:hypothetical protein
MKHHQVVGVCALLCGGAVGCGDVADLTGDEALSQEQAEFDIAPGLTPQPDDLLGLRVALGDFDGNGFDDVVLHAHEKGELGMVLILRSNAAMSLPVQIITPASVDLTPNDPGTSTQFGRELAAGDFNGDGKDDLAMGTPVAKVSDQISAGVVHVAYGGGSSAVSTSGALTITQDSPGVAGGAEAFDYFGATLAVGDFDGNGFDDLAIGVPFEKIGTVKAGCIHVIPGSASGLLLNQSQIFYQGSSGVAGTSVEGDAFGGEFAAGDFNGDGKDDLAVGIPYKDMGSKADAGMIHVFFGSSSLLTTTGDVQLGQDSSGIAGVAAAGDHFGQYLTTGDFNNDGYGDLAVGSPDETVGTAEYAGSVNVIFGSSSGPNTTSEGNYLLNKDSAGVTGTATLRDNFGFALSSGDYNNDGWDDLAVGAIETVSNLQEAGSVYVFLGANAGPSGSTDSTFNQDTPGVGGSVEGSDGFGSSLASGDFNADGNSDLLVGVPYEVVNSVEEAGCANLLLGSSSGVTGAGSYLFTK